MIHTVVITSRLHLLSIMTESGSNPIYFFLKIVIVDENIGSYSIFFENKVIINGDYFTKCVCIYSSRVLMNSLCIRDSEKKKSETLTTV